MSSSVFGVFLTAATIPLLGVLIIIYNKKNHFNGIRNKIYKMMLFSGIIVSSTEIIMALGIYNNFPMLLQEINSRFHYMTMTFWWGISSIYTIILYEKYDKSNKLIDVFKYNTITKILTIFYIILLLFIVFTRISSVNNVDINNIHYFPLPVYYASFLIAGIYVLMALYYIIKERNNINHKEDRYALIAIVILVILFWILQRLFLVISFSGLTLTLFLYMMYFLNENPDLALLKETNISKANLEKVNNTKTDFLYIMSNEVRNPISTIISLCNELKSMNVLDENEIARCSKEISECSFSLLDSVTNILDISKIETGDIKLYENNYDLNELLTNIQDLCLEKINLKQISFEMNINPNISSKLYGDSSKIYQILKNVAINAIKYTNVGKVIINISSIKNENIETLQFKIIDTGIGMTEEEKKNIFMDNIDINKSNSSLKGFGLSLAKKYIDLINGKILIESEYRVGTTVYIEIPQKVVNTIPIGSVKQEDEEAEDYSKYRVLIVDDNELNINAFKRQLLKYKFQIETTTSGIECINKIKNDEKFNIIFIDDIMPEVDGIETMKALKQLKGYYIPPMVVITANAIVGMKEEYLNQGFDDFLSKPINKHELDKLLKRFF